MSVPPPPPRWPRSGLASLVLALAACPGAVAEAPSTAARAPAADDCRHDFDCTDPDRPACEDVACVASPRRCASDDPADDGRGDDGPAVARRVAAPTGATPTVVTGTVCGVERERDFVVLDAEAGTTYVLTLEHPNPVDVDLEIYDRDGRDLRLEYGQRYAPNVTTVRVPTAQPIYVALTTETDDPQAAAYRLEIARPDCASWRDCPADRPVCDGVCRAYASCEGDDGAEPRDDGPGGATGLDGPAGTRVTRGAALCNIFQEVDWYRVDVEAGDELELELSWPAQPGVNLDVRVLDAAGDLQGEAYGEAGWANPDRVRLTYLPAGTYYVQVSPRWFASTDLLRDQSSSSTPYTIAATRRGSAGCASVSDCAAEWASQELRASCNRTTGACERLAGAGQVPFGGLCDSNDDCAGDGRCLDPTFSRDADRFQVCTRLGCERDADCAPHDPPLRCRAVDDVGLRKACIVPCVDDDQCGVSRPEPAPAGLPWARRTCQRETGLCTSPSP